MPQQLLPSSLALCCDMDPRSPRGRQCPHSPKEETPREVRGHLKVTHNGQAKHAVLTPPFDLCTVLSPQASARPLVWVSAPLPPALTRSVLVCRVAAVSPCGARHWCCLCSAAWPCQVRNHWVTLNLVLRNFIRIRLLLLSQSKQT